ncbi:CBS domain-containing protein [Lewinella cohaerens]|uniref:CBS domain-containing protein n=1 Tax=Lewinella cohaerens TaxID=70995 RepID=UPI0003817516|nr:CBS domain-containing protein [Lewinella cohaerens]
MDTNRRLGDIMTTNVITVHLTTTMDVVSDIFEKKNIHHLPVVEKDGTVVGMISKSDYYQLQDSFTLFKRAAAERINQAVFRSLLASEVMSKQVAVLNPDDSVLMAAGYFRENLFHAIPIVDENQRILGIVTTYDLLTYAFQGAAIAN